MQTFTNYGDTTVILDRVVLLRPRNERLVGSYAVPGDLLVGNVRWPPTYPSTISVPGVPAAWKHRQTVPGFRLAPGKSFNMVLGVASHQWEPPRDLAGHAGLLPRFFGHLRGQELLGQHHRGYDGHLCIGPGGSA
jgi:hypothetical protein